MVIVQNRPKRKSTGGRYKKLYRAKRKFETGNSPALTNLGERFTKKNRVKGGKSKDRTFIVNKVNLLDPKSGKCKVVEIKTVKDCPANKNFVRRNIMTKGTLVDTESGLAKITSRPGQEGSLNAVLV